MFKCNDVVWPPVIIAIIVLAKLIGENLRGVGTILEFSKTDNFYFCLIEFEKKLEY